MNKKIVLYNSDVYEYMQENKESIDEFLNDNEIDALPNNIEDAALELINIDFDDLMQSIKEFDNKSNYQKILCVASLGLWYGRRQAKKEFNNLHDALSVCFEDQNKVYFKNKQTTLNLIAYHHDGTNYFKFYKIVNNKKYAIKADELFTCY